MNRFFFHSFPRLRQGETPEAQLKKGLLIAQSMLDNGIVLSPENYEIPLFDREGRVVDQLRATQRRACFTELELEGLSEHSKMFGPFALVYRIDDLRHLGALPVFYIPLIQGAANLSGLAGELLGGFVDAAMYINVLAQIRNWLSREDSLTMTYRGRQVRFDAAQSGTIRDFINVLADAVTADAITTKSKLSILSSCFYPTENPKYTEPLHYYRQREWRLVAAFLTVNGQPASQPATATQKKQLLEIDADFFSKKLKFYDDSVGVNALQEDLIGNRCHFFSKLGTINVVRRAQAIVIPDRAATNAQVWDAYRAAGLRVIQESEIPALAKRGDF
jgi:abortive phage resistance protein AbiGi (putative antitoxin)